MLNGQYHNYGGSNEDVVASLVEPDNIYANSHDHMY